ncbi:hypothetical protein C0Z18_17290 [Trinickia dabaoshanensis]|uniref:Uncharacterized protein n=2 Tax=Trinickia dabaoshanensis TaxID=564714 RepID=A0A2N7VMC7_9BURK|nr:hypothetical protein C0Z18_17290 [Trinickia dabaoshanensis]
MDGVTQIPVKVSYAILDAAGNTIPDQDNASVSLIGYSDGAAMDGAGWTCATSPGKDVIGGVGGCDGVVPSGGTVQYVPRTFYVSHAYSEQSDKPVFTIAVKLDASNTQAGQVWTTKSGATAIGNSDNTTLNLTQITGLPTLSLYFAIASGNNTIVSNGNIQLPIELDYQISSDPSGGTGRPLSTQGNSTNKLVASANGQDFNGYSGGLDPRTYGAWHYGTSGGDSSIAFTPGDATCNGCGTAMLQGDQLTNTYYVTHTKSLMKTQGVQIAASVTYTPPGAPSITWSTDVKKRTPQRACLYVVALSMNQDEES